ncbi:hypothetical protein DPMN_038089 [Dreissena polymorpha]|uniref:Uncharacterized protein n=1 Tax=Dreissena polymorpha TaxID=45954 RepID=A0A9D4MEL2_DREPO|nr:hypothetical protein DPMN_038089 [Dreissena polymorpha]
MSPVVKRSIYMETKVPCITRYLNAICARKGCVLLICLLFAGFFVYSTTKAIQSHKISP